MRRGLLLAALLAGACSGPRVPAAPYSDRPAPAAPRAPSGVTPAEANFQLVVTETVLDPAEEGASFTGVFIDGKEAGRTEVGGRAGEKRLLLKLAPGNQPLRLEHWVLPPVGEWERLPAARQPRERFVRVEEGFVTRVFLRYAVSGPPVLLVQREPKDSVRLKP